MKFREVFLVVFIVTAIGIVVYESVRLVTVSRTEQVEVREKQATERVKDRTRRFPWSKKD